MTQNYQQTWNQNLSEELNFWRRFLTEEEFKENRILRLNLPQVGVLSDLIDAKPKGSIINILDVGSGPLTTIADFHSEYKINLYLADPLADEYNQLLIEAGMPEHARIIKAIGETLIDVFPGNSFDIVHSGNALDHAYNPLLCIENMLKVCKLGGWVYIISYENEGEREHYEGLHQWNFTLVENKIKLWNRHETIYVHEYLNGIRQFIAKPWDFEGNTSPMFQLKIQKGYLDSISD